VLLFVDSILATNYAYNRPDEKVNEILEGGGSRRRLERKKYENLVEEEMRSCLFNIIPSESPM